MAAFSSYAPVYTMKCPKSPAGPLTAGVTNARLRDINYLVNTFLPLNGNPATCTLPASAGTRLVGYFGSRTSTPAGSYGPATAADVQAAIYALTSECAAATHASCACHV
jgi:hypothetical protein